MIGREDELESAANVMATFNRDAGFDVSDFLGAVQGGSGVNNAVRNRRAAFFLLGLSGEVGELQNTFKKVLRQGSRPATGVNRSTGLDLRDEFGDVLAYLLLASDELGYNPAVALAAKMLKNYLRVQDFRSARPSEDGSATLVLLGPTCAGKSGAVSRLATESRRYVEDFRSNPEAMKMIRGESFDALELQLGFVEPMIDWLTKAPRDGLVVIDQHPAVIGLVYAELWHRNGRLNDLDYVRLLDRSVHACSLLWARPGPLKVLHLTATSKTLRERHTARDGDAPPLTWFDDLVELTERLLKASSNEIRTIDSTDLSREAVLDLIRSVSGLDSSDIVP